MTLDYILNNINSSLSRRSGELHPEQAKKLIIEWCLSRVPDNNDLSDSKSALGWQACRNQIIKNIKEDTWMKIQLF